MGFTFAAVLFAVVLFLGMLTLFETGRRLGNARRARDPDGVDKGSGPAGAAVFGLLGLLLAFSFSGAASRFEDRRHLVAEEANAIGTAYLRLDLLPPDAQPELRQLFKSYLDTRVNVYRNGDDLATTKAGLARTIELQNRIWSGAVAASQRADAPTSASMLLLPALNQMIDVTTLRVVASQNHPPLVIFLLLAGLSLVSAVLIGYATCGTLTRGWLYMMAVGATMALTFYVIIDLEFPRLGLIRVDAADQVLIDLLATMR